MTRRTVVLLGLLLLLVGCSRDDEVNQFVTNMNQFTSDLVKKVESSADKKTGVESAQQFLDQKGPALKTEFEALQDVRGFQVKDETMSNITTAVTDNVTKVGTLKIDYMALSLKDKDFDQKIEKLTNSYTDLFGQ
jgi:PBP1b-binding outer membrane lipoprotein LpoB